MERICCKAPSKMAGKIGINLYKSGGLSFYAYVAKLRGKSRT